MESYDPHTNKWSPVANMCKRRGGVGVGLSLSSFLLLSSFDLVLKVGVVNGFLYAIGGHDAPAVSNPQQSRFNCMERYILTQIGRMRSIANMNLGYHQ